MTGAVTAAAGSSVASGTPAGTDDLVVNGNLTMGSGSTFAARLNGNVAGSSYDQVSVTGSSAITLTGSTLTLSGPMRPLPADVLTIILNGPNTQVTGTFANPSCRATRSAGSTSVSITRTSATSAGSGTISGGNDVVVYNFVPVPEPGSILLIAAAATAAAGRVRRRRTTS